MSSLVVTAGDSALHGSEVKASRGPAASRSPSAHRAHLPLRGSHGWGRGRVKSGLFLPGGTYHPGSKTTAIMWSCSHRAIQRA